MFTFWSAQVLTNFLVYSFCFVKQCTGRVNDSVGRHSVEKNTISMSKSFTWYFKGNRPTYGMYFKFMDSYLGDTL